MFGTHGVSVSSNATLDDWFMIFMIFYFDVSVENNTRTVN
jgi:hypothetical protein